MKSPQQQTAIESASLTMPVKAYIYRFWLSLLLFIVISYCSFMDSFLVGVLILSLLDIALCADIIFRNAWHDVEKGKFTLSVLVASSSAASFGYGLSKTFLSNPWREYSAFYKTGMNRLNF